jgi:hypothetical protein
MYRTVAFDPELERWVRQIEESPPNAYPVALSTALRFRVPEERFYLAGALAVARAMSHLCQAPSTQPPGLTALYAASRVAALLPAEERVRPLQQVLAAINGAIHSREYGPYRLPEAEPVRDGAPEVTAARFVDAVERRNLFAADHRFVALVEEQTPEELRSLLFRIVVPRAVESGGFGNHVVLLLAQIWRLMAWLGFEHRGTLLRPLVHRLASMPQVPPGFEAARALARAHRLGSAPDSEPGNETEVVALRETLTACKPGEQANEVAQALASGLAREDTWHAVSLAAADQMLALSHDADPAMHASAGATIHALRWLSRDEERAAQILALLQAANCLADAAARGGNASPSVSRADTLPARASAVVNLSPQPPPRSGEGEPDVESPLSVSGRGSGGGVNDPTAPEGEVNPLELALAAGDVARSLALAQREIAEEDGAGRLLGRLARAASRSTEPELPLVHFHAMAEEFETGPMPHRRAHLLAAVRYAAAYRPSGPPLSE